VTSVSNDRGYYARREHECRARAEAAAEPSIKSLHSEFADRYARLLASVADDAAGPATAAD